MKQAYHSPIVTLPLVMAVMRVSVSYIIELAKIIFWFRRDKSGLESVLGKLSERIQ